MYMFAGKSTPHINDSPKHKKISPLLRKMSYAFFSVRHFRENPSSPSPFIATPTQCLSSASSLFSPLPEDDGFETDEDAIIEILGHRDANQRKKIRETYHKLYNETLIDALKSELSGDFGKAVILWTYDPSERDARLANEALKLKKKGIKHLKIIVEMSCTSSPQHLVAARQAYCTLFDHSIEEDIIASVPPSLRTSAYLTDLTFMYIRFWEIAFYVAIEFVLFKLKEMGKICQQDISVIMEEFENLYVD